jgi:hypothetical protein
VARKPPPERASASGGWRSGAGGSEWVGSVTAHGSIRSEDEVPIAGEVRGVPSLTARSWFRAAEPALLDLSTPPYG